MLDSAGGGGDYTNKECRVVFRSHGPFGPARACKPSVEEGRNPKSAKRKNYSEVPEDFIALNILKLATDENKDFFTVLKEIVEMYNRRLLEVETDLSLQIEVR